VRAAPVNDLQHGSIRSRATRGFAERTLDDSAVVVGTSGVREQQRQGRSAILQITARRFAHGLPAAVIRQEVVMDLAGETERLADRAERPCPIVLRADAAEHRAGATGT